MKSFVPMISARPRTTKPVETVESQIVRTEALLEKWKRLAEGGGPNSDFSQSQVRFFTRELERLKGEKE